MLRDVAREVEMILKVSGKSNFAASVKNANPARLDELLRKADLIPDDPHPIENGKVAEEVEPTDSESRVHHYLLSQALRLLSNDNLKLLAKDLLCRIPKFDVEAELAGNLINPQPIQDGKVSDSVEHECAYCGAMTAQPDDECYAKPTTRKQPPVLEWDGNYAKSVNYQCAIYEKTAIDYVVECYYMGVRFYNDIHCQSSARLAAENAVLRHWIENLK